MVTLEFGEERSRGCWHNRNLLKALDDPIDFSEDVYEDQQQELLGTATDVIIFHLSDSRIRLIDKEDTSTKIWKKLDKLFQKKSLTNKIFLKVRQFSFQRNIARNLEQNLDEFLRMTIQLANLGEGEALSDGEPGNNNSKFATRIL